jgi:hypothetical protein
VVKVAAASAKDMPCRSSPMVRPPRILISELTPGLSDPYSSRGIPDCSGKGLISLGFLVTGLRGMFQVVPEHVILLRPH